MNIGRLLVLDPIQLLAISFLLFDPYRSNPFLLNPLTRHRFFRNLFLRIPFLCDRLLLNRLIWKIPLSPSPIRFPTADLPNTRLALLAVAVWDLPVPPC